MESLGFIGLGAMGAPMARGTDGAAARTLAERSGVDLASDILTRLQERGGARQDSAAVFTILDR
jgi:hypothetical protein